MPALKYTTEWFQTYQEILMADKRYKEIAGLLNVSECQIGPLRKQCMRQIVGIPDSPAIRSRLKFAEYEKKITNYQSHQIKKK